jgi:4-amino-4-deoxy-L-arabinose transferase-like glycosyltransferase
MPAHPEHPRFKGIPLPPSGWTLAVLLALYIFTGLVGHDPWKNDDALTIGIVHDIVANGNWLTPGLAGRPYPDAPLYYWVAAASSQVFSWFLPVHAGARLASGLCTLLALAFILLAARELHGREAAPAAPLLLAGSIGFLFHAHEAQPMLAALTAHTAAYWGLFLLGRKPVAGACYFGSALGLGFLANGLPPMLPLVPLAAFVVWRSEKRQQAALLLVGSLLLAAALGGAWLIALLANSPDYLAAFWRSESTQLHASAQPLVNLWGFVMMLPWYAWPAFPLAGWTLWAKRRQFTTRPLALPVVRLPDGTSGRQLLLRRAQRACLAVAAAAGAARRSRRHLAAARRRERLRLVRHDHLQRLRGVVWVAWCATVFGWPERLARQASRLEPGFIGHLSIPAVGLALFGTAVWCWLIATSPRSPMRGIMHWMAGLTLFWLLTATLLMPWVDHGKTYRPVSASLARALPERAIASLVPMLPTPFSLLSTTLTEYARSPPGRKPVSTVTGY